MSGGYTRFDTFLLLFLIFFFNNYLSFVVGFPLSLFFFISKGFRNLSGVLRVDAMMPRHVFIYYFFHCHDARIFFLAKKKIKKKILSANCRDYQDVFPCVCSGGGGREITKWNFSSFFARKCSCGAGALRFLCGGGWVGWCWGACALDHKKVELRHAFALADLERTGGVSAHVSPLAGLPKP